MFDIPLIYLKTPSVSLLFTSFPPFFPLQAVQIHLGGHPWMTMLDIFSVKDDVYLYKMKYKLQISALEW